MSIKCKVNFSNGTENVFYAGQTMCGNIQVFVEKEQLVSGIRIRISAHGYSVLKKYYRTKVYRENFLNCRISVSGNVDRQIS